MRLFGLAAAVVALLVGSTTLTTARRSRSRAGPAAHAPTRLRRARNGRHNDVVRARAPALVAEVGRRLVVSVSLVTAEPIADPFRARREVVELLQVRAP